MTKLYPWVSDPVCPKCGAVYKKEIGMGSGGDHVYCVHSKVWLPEDKKESECLEWTCRECRGIWWMETYENAG